MASKFLEEALRTDVDESSVNAILETTSSSVQHNVSHQSSITNLNVNNNNTNSSSALSTTNGGGGSTNTSQKHHGVVANGEISSQSVINHRTIVNASVDTKTNKINHSETTNSLSAPIFVHSGPTTSSSVLAANGNNTNHNNSSSSGSSTTTTSFVNSSGQVIVTTQQHHYPSLAALSSSSTSATVFSSSAPPPLTTTNIISGSASGGAFPTITSNTIISSSTINNNNNMSKNNEPVKLVYPNQQHQTSGGQQQGQVLNMNSRLTFTNQSLPNGTINIGQPQQQHQQIIQQQTSSGMAVVSGAPVLKTTNQQQPHLVIQKQGTNQNMVQTSMMPGVQILNVRPNAPANQQTQQKTVAAVSPRVVTHMVGARPSNAGVSNTQQLTLSALQNLQNSGQPGQAILLKTENGQFQLLRVGPSPVVGGQQNMTSSANQTIRLQTVPAVSRFTGPPLALRKTIVTQQQVKAKANQQTIASSASSSIVVNSVSHAGPMHHQQQQQQQPQLQQQQQQHQPQQQQTIQTSVAAPPVASVAPVVVTANTAPANQQNTKEKCRKFLANLLELSSREPKPVERNVRTLIQELIDANVEPEEFCDRLERLLNASPQPCLIGFLKKSLPLLRQSLVTKELVIDGIKPPPNNVAFGGTTTIQAQVRPIGQTIVSTGPVRITQPRPIGQTTITRHTTPVRYAANQQPQRLINATVSQLRPSIVQGGNVVHHQMNPPALQPVSNTSMHQGGFTPGGAQIRPPRTPAGLQIRQATPKQQQHQLQLQQQHQQQQQQQQHHQQPQLHQVHQLHQTTAKTTTTVMKLGSTQIKQISNSNMAMLVPPSMVAVSTATTTLNNVYASSANTAATMNSHSSAPPLTSSSSNITHIINNVVAASAAAATTASSMVNSSGHPVVMQTKAIPSKGHQLSTGPATATSVTSSATAAATTTASTSKAASTAAKDKEKKTTASAAAASAFYQQSPALSMASSMYGDDDINDVAAMGGVNLAEESQRILGSTELIGTQIRSCKDEVFLHLPALQSRIRQVMAKHGLEEPSTDVAMLISHAAQERLKNVVEKLAVIAEHRIDIIKVDPRYEITKDVRGQIKFLEELDKAEQKRHEEQEREMLMRAAKSRSKTEDPEQAKLKAKAKEMQRAEMEELRQRDANLTALQAIGPRKKPRLEGETTTTSTTGGTGASTTGTPPAPLRPRIKRVNLKDMVFYLEQERETCRSSMLYKAYLK